MGTTPVWLLPYPELSDPPDGPAQIKALAEKLETQLTAVNKRDSGWIDLTSVTSFKTNYIADSSPCRGRRIGPLAFLDLNAKRATAALVADASGNFTDHDILTVNDARFQPEMANFVMGAIGAYSGLTVILTTTQPVHWLLQAISGASATIAIGQACHLTACYLSSTAY